VSETVPRRVTATDIARAAGVSRATVGFVVNGTPGQRISPATRERVLLTAARLGYRPNTAARTLVSGRSRVILLVLPDWPLEFAMRIFLEETSRVLDEAGYSLVTCTRNPATRARPLWETVHPDVVIGMAPLQAADVASLRAQGVARIFPDPGAPPPEGTLYAGDGPRLQAEHLSGLGHRRLGYASATDPRFAILSRSRLQVAQQAASSLGLPPLNACEAGHPDGSAGQAVRAWREAGITGVIAFNDDTAAAVVGSALRAGIRVPDDLAVIGHDDSPLASMFVPSLSSIQVDSGAAGRSLAEIAVRLAKAEHPVPALASPDTVVIARESTLPAQQALPPRPRAFGVQTTIKETSVTYALDHEIAQTITALGASTDRPPIRPAPRGDWKTLRANSEAAVPLLASRLPEHAEVARTGYSATSHDGAPVALRWFAPAGHDPSRPGPAAVFMHGGGMIAGSVEHADRVIAAYAAGSGVPILAVDYRLAPEHPHPSPVEDCYAGLAWLTAHASELGVGPSRIAVMGESAGGGLAAGTALLARDRGLPVASQILIYPMLDDRTTTPDAALAPFAFWSYDDNYTGWHALLGDKTGTADVPAPAAPARAADLAGMPATYVEVGALDIFRDEAIEYARRLAAAGASIELHVQPGCPHGFELIAPDSGVARRARADRLRTLASF
jgi:acetyl esterase/lipase